MQRAPRRAAADGRLSVLAPSLLFRPTAAQTARGDASRRSHRRPAMRQRCAVHACNRGWSAGADWKTRSAHSCLIEAEASSWSSRSVADNNTYRTDRTDRTDRGKAPPPTTTAWHGMANPDGKALRWTRCIPLPASVLCPRRRRDVLSEAWPGSARLNAPPSTEAALGLVHLKGSRLDLVL